MTGRVCNTCGEFKDIDSSRGYTPDNIQIISNRANMLKNNATLEELRKIVAHLEVITIGDISDG